MFNKIEFSDLYRFLTSIGLVVIALSLLLPWLYTNNDGTHITTEDYVKLTEASKHLVDKQIRLNSIVLVAIPIATPILFLIGIIISGIGLRKWKTKQDAIDETDNIKLENLRLERLSKDEIQKKAEEEVKEEITEIKEVPEEKESFEVDYEALSQHLMDLENQFFKKILDYNTFEYEPVSNVRIDDKYQADILLRSYNLKSKHDVLIEIKYLQKGLSMALVINAHERLSKMYGQYFSQTRRHARQVLIIVYKSTSTNEQELKRFRTAIEDFDKSTGTRFQIFVMNEQEAAQFDVTQIL